MTEPDGFWSVIRELPEQQEPKLPDVRHQPPLLVPEQDVSPVPPAMMEIPETSPGEVSPVSASRTEQVQSEVGDFDARQSKRELIRQKLREKEKRLSQMISTPSSNQLKASTTRYSNPDDSSTIEERNMSSATMISTVGKEEADRREAVRVLSQAALQTKKRLQKEKQQTSDLRREVKSLKSSIKENETQKSFLEKELRKVQAEKDLEQEKMMIMHHEHEEKMHSLRKIRGQEFGDTQDDLPTTFEEVVWNEKEAVSKAEQLEYFEYQLFAKNNEIDDMKQELSKMLRRIVELEIDLEIHDDRFHTAFSEDSRSESVGSTIITTGVKNTSFPHQDMIVDSSHPSMYGERRSRRGSLDGLKKMLTFPKRRSTTKSGQLKASNDVSQFSGNLSARLERDLTSLEARYKRDMYHNRLETAQLKQENSDYLIKVISLEKALQKKGTSLDDEVDDTRPGTQSIVSSSLDSNVEHLPNKTLFLQEKVKALENDRDLHVRKIESLSGEIAQLRKEAEYQSLQGQQTAEKLRLESQAKDLKISALERELLEHTTKEGQEVKTRHINAAAELEAKLMENIAEVIRLRKEQEIKDKKIEALRAEIIELRIQRMQHEKAAQLDSQETERSLDSIRGDNGAGVRTVN
jgi:chromosome segregation ATPase